MQLYCVLSSHENSENKWYSSPYYTLYVFTTICPGTNSFNYTIINCLSYIWKVWLENKQLTPNHARVATIPLTARDDHFCLYKDEEDIGDTQTDHMTERALPVEVLKLGENKVDENRKKKEN